MTAESSPRHGRLPWPARADLDPAATSVYDAIASGPRATGPQHFRLTSDEGRLEGPFNALVLAPQVGQAVQELGAAIRYRTALTARQREIAILAIAAAARSDFEWYAHEAVGRAAGLTGPEIAALRAGEPSPTFEATEALVWRICHGLATTRALAPVDAADGEAWLGVAGLVELVTLTGYYLMLDLAMRAFDTPLPAGVQSPFGPTTGD